LPYPVLCRLEAFNRDPCHVRDLHGVELTLSIVRGIDETAPGIGRADEGQVNDSRIRIEHIRFVGIARKEEAQEKNFSHNMALIRFQMRRPKIEAPAHVRTRRDNDHSEEANSKEARRLSTSPDRTDT
jgi:hypothetical protein